MKEQGYNMHMNKNDYFMQHETNILREELRMLYEDFESMKNEYLSLYQDNIELNKRVSFLDSEVVKYLEGHSEENAKNILNKIKEYQTSTKHKLTIFAEFQGNPKADKEDIKQFVLENIKNSQKLSSLDIIKIEIS